MSNEKQPRVAKTKQPERSKFDPSYCDLLIDHMANGLSYKAFAGVVKVERKTLYNWEKDHEAWAAAKAVARGCHRLFWEQKMIDGLYPKALRDEDGNYLLDAKGNHVVGAFNTTLAIAIMNNSYWRNNEEKKAKARGSEDSAAVRELADQMKAVMHGDYTPEKSGA